jgi:methanogenic corrinoid protein MtbC1
MVDAGASLGSSQSSRSHPGGSRSRPQRGDAGGALEQERPVIGNFEVARFIKILLSHDEQAAHAFAGELLDRGASTEQLYEFLFAEAARKLGEMWTTDDCSFYDVTLGTGRIQRLVREFSHQFLVDHVYPGSTGRLLLCSAADEQHSLGLAVLAEFFVRDGWDVHVGPGLGSEALLDKVRETDYHMIGFSVAVTSRIAKLQQDIRRVRQVSRNPDIKVMVGGFLITEDPSLAERIGADGYATDAASAIAAARQLLPA